MLIKPAYPYGKRQVYLGGSLVALAAQLLDAGLQVSYVDLNLTSKKELRARIREARPDVLGITVTGAPYIPVACQLCIWLRQEHGQRILVGGQPIAALREEEFGQIFAAERVVQIKSDQDVRSALGLERDLRSWDTLSYVPAYALLERAGYLTQYLCSEIALPLSQNCGFTCDFCAAQKGKREIHRGLAEVEADLRYLVGKARSAGSTSLDFYVSNLDFFQTWRQAESFLKLVARLRTELQFSIRFRCLSCLTSFKTAGSKIENFNRLLSDGGLIAVGFGIDGADPKIWRSQKKTHNRLSDVDLCFGMCKEARVSAEFLIVFGMPQDTAVTLLKSFWKTLWSTIRWRGVVTARPYLAKPVVPGNHGWSSPVELPARLSMLRDPELFYNLDFAACGGRLTHPRRWHRWCCNAAYLALCGTTWLLGKCLTSPLLPQGSGGRFSRQFARAWNRFMPFDK